MGEEQRIRPQLPPGSYPFTSRWLDRNGLRMHYLDEGQGEPVVMLHGNPTWSFYYRELVKQLRTRFRCIVPDHIGCGMSDKPGDSDYPYTLASRIDDLAALLEHLGVADSYNMVVHDWGGGIGFGYARANPAAVQRLVILNTAAFPLPDGKPFPAPLWLTRTPLGALLVRGGNAFSRGTSMIACRRKKLSRALRRTYEAPYDTWQHRIATLRFVQDIPLQKSDPAWPILAEMEASLEAYQATPTLIGWGLRDFVFDEHFLNTWRRHLPQAEVRAWDDCGHYVLEDAEDRLLPLIQQHLEKPL